MIIACPFDTTVTTAIDVDREIIVTVQAYMVVLCATWRTALNVYDLLCEIVQRYHSVRPLLMYGASGDRDVEVRM